jgi:hypothetical protein
MSRCFKYLSDNWWGARRCLPDHHWTGVLSLRLELCGGYLWDPFCNKSACYLHTDRCFSQDEGFSSLPFSSEVTSETLLGRRTWAPSSPSPCSLCPHEHVMIELGTVHIPSMGWAGLVAFKLKKIFFDCDIKEYIFHHHPHAHRYVTKKCHKTLTFTICSVFWCVLFCSLLKKILEAALEMDLICCCSLKTSCEILQPSLDLRSTAVSSF